MSEITEMILNGMLCQCCGAYLNSSQGNFPQYCSECKIEEQKKKGNHKKHPSMFKGTKGKLVERKVENDKLDKKINTL